MKKLIFISLAILIFGVIAANADVIPVEPDHVFLLDSVLGDPESEADWIEGETGASDLVYLWKTDATDGAVGPGGFSVSLNDPDAGTAQVSWDLTGSGFELYYILLKDGNVDGKFLYSLYGVSEDQRILSGGKQTVDFGDYEKAISHISFFGKPGTSVPEPSLILLLGIGLSVVSVTSIRFKKN